jgi:hypothetical protein
MVPTTGRHDAIGVYVNPHRFARQSLSSFVCSIVLVRYLPYETKNRGLIENSS